MDSGEKVFKNFTISILDKLLNNEDLTNEKDTFIWLLKGLKENSKLIMLVDDNIVLKMIQSIDFVEDYYQKSEVISTILNCMYDIEYDFNSNSDIILKLFNLFLECINNGFEMEKEIKEIFFLFSELGIEYDIIFKECVKRLRKEFCINIFSLINMKWDDLGEYSDLIDLVVENRKIRKRFDLMLRFYLMVDMSCVNKANVVNSFLAHPFNYTGLWADWLFFSNQQPSYYDDVISIDEKRIFTQIGDIYNECKTDVLIIRDESKDEEFDDIWAFYANAGEKFQLVLNSKQVKHLLEKFTDGRSFWEIALNLPN